MAARTIWKGAISFGLVHIPVGLHTATSESGVDFDWLDKRSMDPVGYKRINKRTGKEIDKDNIVKGVEYEDGKYVIVSPDEIADAYPRTTQTIEIQQFVDATDVSFVYLERPYYVAPINKGHKVYALLRDTLAKTGKIGIAKVVIQTKQHLAALIPSGDALVLNLMRWGDEVKSVEGLDLPKAGAKNMTPSASELKMAKMLVEDMSGQWDPEQYQDEFKAAVMELVEKKARAGKTETVIEPQEESPTYADNVIDLTELLQRSLKGGKGAPKAASSAGKAGNGAARKAAKSAAKKTAAKKATAKTTGSASKASGKTAAKTASKARKAA
ncbi:Non-homologous end joining protein Ku [Achromobacter mucicolens]|jgi:DNA end-binding protein Ku|uniref:non-homologous end joining protein Ku n=1 Tax=Achromobacter mucicolens TaxID=1389922 RepID=UPI00146785C3|nr:Ku protein [Achromobacter mucicolens]CAB3827570.1 Non-homologous end joining protein Ku [Achromobacter mucicolens]